MRTHHLTILQIEEELGQYTKLVDVVSEYEGPVAECKKGREGLGANAAAGQKQAGVNNANEQQSYNQAQSLLGEDIGSSTPGSLTPAAQAQLASDNDNINRVYNGMRQQAFSSLQQRGFNNAPSGFTTATMNGINQNEGNAETGAYRNAQENTQAQRNFATQEEGTLSGQQGQLGASNLGLSTNAFMDQNRAGSTLGDIAQGVGDAVDLVSPIAGAVGTIGKAFSGIGAGSQYSPASMLPGVNTYTLGKNTGTY